MKKGIISIVFALIASGILGFITEEVAVEQPYAKPDREVSLVLDQDTSLFFNKPENFPTHAYIKIYKSKRILELYGDNKLIGRFRIALGQSPEGDKTCEGDSKTPVGKYYICTRNKKSKFTLFLGLSYPNTEDAELGLINGMITRDEYDIIKRANEQRKKPPWNTALGGGVGIHGGGTESDWIQGCIALSDKDIYIIWAYTSYKTPVEIFE